MINIRFATPDDAALVAQFSRQAFYDTFAQHNTEEDMKKFMDEQFSASDLMTEVKQPGNVFILVFDDDQLAGYAFMREKSLPDELTGLNAIEIARIYAGQSFIGKGIGKALMENCLAVATEKGKNLVWLGVWEHNQTAISFYKKWGFEKFSTHEFVLGTDVQTDWLMKKTLGNKQAVFTIHH